MDFFVSYTSVDRPWAEWITWQLEAGGYQLVMQSWDIIAGRGLGPPDAAGHVDRRACRSSAVARLPHSVHGEAEWRPFYGTYYSCGFSVGDRAAAQRGAWCSCLGYIWSPPSGRVIQAASAARRAV